MNTDKIEKKVVIKAPVARVWRAIADSGEFGAWFGVVLEGPFVAGQSIRGRFENVEELTAQITAEQARLGLEPSEVKLSEKAEVFCTVERIEPERYFSFRWLPYAGDVDVDPLTAPQTLVELHLEAQEGGTLLTIVESGWDKVPAKLRERAFMMNDAGWTQQAKNIARHVEGH